MSEVHSKEQETATKLYAGQNNYLESGDAAKEGSVAIAAGRTAGLAVGAGLENIANAIWREYIPNVEGMPSFAEFRKGYLEHQNSEGFERFATGVENPDHPEKAIGFPHAGTVFSNAAGSYAYALDVAARGEEALAGGEREPTANWGYAALKAAGFEKQADTLRDAIVNKKILGTVKTLDRQ